MIVFCETTSVQSNGIFVHTCVNCGSVTKTGVPRLVRPCGIKVDKSELCSHRGEQVGQVECDGCKGRVRIKVFACDRHGSCCIRAKVDGHSTCVMCPDWQAIDEAIRLAEAAG